MLECAVVGIDPGMVTGWAVLDHGVAMSGTWQLKAGNESYLKRLADQLASLIAEHKPDLICYEEPVARGMAARSLNRQLGVIILVCEQMKVPHYPVNPGTLKKHATGSGRADKEEMLLAAQQRGLLVTDHNACDAFWLADYGRNIILPTMETTQ